MAEEILTPAISQPMPMGMGMESPEMEAPEPMESPEVESNEMGLEDSLEELNLADRLDEELLTKIGDEVVRGFDEDEDSRIQWRQNVEEWVKLATMVMETKSFPWPNAANVKYPLLATAAMQFAARAYPSLVPGQEPVQAYVVKDDDQGTNYSRSKRISKHMSYQLMYEMEDWEEEMDRLCFILPIVGCAFKKTYYDPLKEKNVSELVTAENLVVNYWAKTIESAPRKTHLIYRNKNEIEERVRAGIYKEVELNAPVPYDPFNNGVKETSGTKEPGLDETTPYTILEQHTWYDLDEDGYKEPWIITVEYTSRKVLRIVPRFDQEGIKTNEGKIVSIKPVEYFTKFSFIPNPDGGIYDVGFGLLLGGINQSLNTLANQLLDSGTLNNLQAGFIGRGIRIRGGNLRFSPGEWKQADFTGEDISKNIFPLPTKEPSSVLLSLFELLLNSGKELASMAEIMVGKMPGQNTPATTTQMTVEQSLKVFTAIYKRLYRALSKEYMKLFRLNKFHMDDKLYFALNSDQSQPPEMVQIMRSDYVDSILVKPNADPNVVSEAQELVRAQSLFELMQTGQINMQEAVKRILKAQKQPNIAALLQPNPPQPSPEQQQMEMKQQEMQMKMQIEQEKAALKAQQEQMKLMIAEQQGKMDIVMKQMELQLKEAEHNLKLKHASMEHQMDVMQSQADMQINQQQNAQKMELNQASHDQNLKMLKEKEKMNAERNQQRGVSGVEGKSGNKRPDAGNRGKAGAD